MTRGQFERFRDDVLLALVELDVSPPRYVCETEDGEHVARWKDDDCIVTQNELAVLLENAFERYQTECALDGSRALE